MSCCTRSLSFDGHVWGKMMQKGRTKLKMKSSLPRPASLGVWGVKYRIYWWRTVESRRQMLCLLIQAQVLWYVKHLWMACGAEEEGVWQHTMEITASL